MSRHFIIVMGAAIDKTSIGKPLANHLVWDFCPAETEHLKKSFSGEPIRVLQQILQANHNFFAIRY